MKLVVVYSRYAGNDEWVDVYEPLEYGTVEDFKEDFMAQLKEARWAFIVGKVCFRSDDFCSVSEDGVEYFYPEVYTLDAWFELYKPH